jgi:hypothetical protein
MVRVFPFVSPGPISVNEAGRGSTPMFSLICPYHCLKVCLIPGPSLDVIFRCNFLSLSLLNDPSSHSSNPVQGRIEGTLNAAVLPPVFHETKGVSSPCSRVSDVDHVRCHYSNQSRLEQGLCYNFCGTTICFLLQSSLHLALPCPVLEHEWWSNAYPLAAGTDGSLVSSPVPISPLLACHTGSEMA